MAYFSHILIYIKLYGSILIIYFTYGEKRVKILTTNKTNGDYKALLPNFHLGYSEKARKFRRNGE